MPTDPEVETTLDLVTSRIDVLSLLADVRLQKRELVDELGHSRSTVNRAVADLAEAGLVEDRPAGCRTTFVGSLLADEYRAYVETAADVLRCREVLSALPPDCDLSPVALADAEAATPGGPSPYEPYHAMEAVLRRPGPEGRVRAYVPAFSNPRGVELARSLAAELPVELVFTDQLLSELRADVPDEVAALFDLESFTGYRTDGGPRYTVLVAESESGTEGVVVTHTAERDLGGTIVTSDPGAVRWLEDRYVEIRAESERLDSLPE